MARKSARAAEAPGTARAVAAVDSAEAKVLADRAERSLGRAIGLGLPVTGVVGALGVGFTLGIGQGILVLAGGAILGAIALVWASVRTLSGDAPLPEDLEAVAARRHSVDDAAERKHNAMRALKDLEYEHAVGKIDDADFASLSSAYRAQAKEVMREMDADVAPLLERAEKLAEAHLRKRGFATAEATASEPAEDATADASEPVATETTDARPSCGACGAANDADAAFCKKCGKPLATSDDADAGGKDASA